MKKIFAMLLAVMMVFSLATVAFADETPTPEESTEPVIDSNVDNSSYISDVKTKGITLKKVYTVNGEKNSALYPAEELTFTVVEKEGVENPDDDPKVTVDTLTVTSNGEHTIYVNLPSYDTVGVYEYTIKEDEGSTQGVVYTTAEIDIKVLVTYDYENKKLESEVVLSTSGSGDLANDKGKIDTFSNTYNVGHLTVQKTISGNLADSSEYFKMTVTFTSTETVASAITVSGGSLTGDGADGDKYTEGLQTNPTTIAVDEWTYAEGTTNGTATATIYLKAGDTLSFDNIPDGVTYAVEEDAQHQLGENETVDPNGDAATDYTVTYTGKTGEIVKEETDAAVVNNDKKTSVETGIALDSMPYVLILAVAAVGLVLFTTKKRVQE